MDEHVERATRTRVIIPAVGGHRAAEILDPPQVRLVAGDRPDGPGPAAVVAGQPGLAWLWRPARTPAPGADACDL
jgi:hypothetical protein